MYQYNGFNINTSTSIHFVCPMEGMVLVILWRMRRLLDLILIITHRVWIKIKIHRLIININNRLPVDY